MSRNLVRLTASLCSAGFHPAAWRVCSGTSFPIGRRYQAMARIAEAGRFDGVWLGHDPLLPLDPLPLMGSLIAVTQRIGLGARWVVEHAEPFHVARVFATLDHLASGRTGLIVGLPGEGPGAEQFGHVPALAAEAGLERAGELIDVARQLWDSWEDAGWLLDVASGRFADPDHVHPIEHRGRYFGVRGPLNLPRPPQGHPVVAFEVMEDPGELAMKEADVLLLSCRSRDAAASVRRAARGSQRVLVNVMPILGASEAAATDRAATLDGLEQGQGGKMRFVGTPGQLIDLFADWVEAGVCDGFNLVPAVLPDDLESIVAEVVPIGQARGVLRAAYEGTTLREHLGLARPPR